MIALLHKAPSRVDIGEHYARRANQKDFDTTSLEKSVSGKKASAIHVTRSGEIDASFLEKNDWDQSMRSLAPLIFDLSIVYWNNLKPHTLKKLRKTLDVEFEYLGNKLNNLYRFPQRGNVAKWTCWQERAFIGCNVICLSLYFACELFLFGVCALQVVFSYVHAKMLALKNMQDELDKFKVDMLASTNCTTTTVEALQYNFDAFHIRREQCLDYMDGTVDYRLRTKPFSPYQCRRDQHL